jgi:uncharacterized damage-inducible protein DinB
MQPDPQSPLQVIYDSWRGYNTRLQKCIAPLTGEQLGLQPAPRMWPLGQVVQHIVSVRVGWFCATLQDPDPRMEEYFSWGQRESPERSAAELVRGLDETWSFIESRLQRWTPADYASTFPDEDEHGQVWDVSRSWVVYHVLEHDLHHGSEVSMILGMHGLQPIEI